MKKRLLSLFGILALGVGTTQAQVYVDENFDVITPGNVPAGWTVTSPTPNPDTWQVVTDYSTNDLDGTPFLFIDDDAFGSGNSTQDYIEFDVTGSTGASNVFLDFDHYWRASGTASVEVWDGSAWQVVATYSGASVGAWGAPSSESIDITAHNNAALKVRFYYDDGGNWAWYWAIDNVLVQTIACPDVTGFTQDYLVTDTMAMSWTGSAGSYNIEYGPVGYTPGTGAELGAQSTTNNVDTLFGLATGTVYDVYIQSDCGGGDLGQWIGPITFYTVDDLGYLVWDSTCTTPFEDIAATGTATGLGDDGTIGVTIPFYFQLDGLFSNELTIDNNGGIEFGTLSGGVGFSNGAISGSVNGFHPFWDDIDNDAGDVYYETRGTAPNRRFIVQWDDRPHFNNVGNATFQVVLFEGSNEFVYVYEDVDFGNASYNNGASATVGTKTDLNDAEVSYNTPSIMDGMCIHWSYVSCPAVDDVNITYIGVDTVIFDITPRGTESSWTIEYGPAGFTPGSGTTMTSTTTTDTIPGLSQYTEYDFYVVSDCGGGDMSNAYGPINFTTLPVCPNPTGLTATYIAQDTIILSWTAGGTETMWNVEWGLTGFTQGTGTTIAFDTNPDTLIGTPDGSVLDIYIEGDCGGGTTNPWFGPIQVATPIVNDSTCDAVNLMMDSTYTYSNINATVQVGETRGTGGTTAYNTVWFTFTAPTSGAVEFDLTGSDFDAYTTLYEATDCDDFNTFTAVSGYDNEFFNECDLTPGNMYYVQVGGWGMSDEGIIEIRLTDLDIDAGTPLAADICAGTTIDLNATITGGATGGMWTETNPMLGMINGSDYMSSQFQAAGAYQVEYRVMNACRYDSVLVDVMVYQSPSAGMGGTIAQECNFGEVNLVDGLSGTVDLGGTWLDSNGDTLATSTVEFNGEAAGQYVYTYVASNGVCTDDSAMVTVDLIDCTSLGENDANGAISIYPNPTTGLIFINNQGNDDDFVIEVTDVNGKMINNIKVDLNKGETYQMDLNTQVNGVYFIRIKSSTGIGQHKVIVQ